MKVCTIGLKALKVDADEMDEVMDEIREIADEMNIVPEGLTGLMGEEVDEGEVEDMWNEAEAEPGVADQQPAGGQYQDENDELMGLMGGAQ